MRVAFALAMLDGRVNVNSEDWELSATVASHLPDLGETLRLASEGHEHRRSRSVREVQEPAGTPEEGTAA